MTIPAPPADFPEKGSPNVDELLRANLIASLVDGGVVEPEKVADELISQAQTAGHVARLWREANS